MTIFDLVIVGGGPAGCAAALRATAAGASVAMLSTTRRHGFVESLPPAGRRLLADLGCWDAFVRLKPTTSRGTRSVWGSSQPVERESIRDPDGTGWQLDRRVFDAFLQLRVAGSGVTVVPGRLRSVSEQAEHVECTDERGQRLQGRFLLDTSDRSATAAIRLGAHRHYDDAIVASVTSYTVAATDADRRTVIESGPDGWWYSICTDDLTRTVGRLTDADLPRPTEAPAELAGLLEGAVAQQQPRRVAANSGYLQPFAGERWLAAGDAALSFDPLSSQGILTAMFCGRAAADAVLARLAGDTGFDGYVRRLEAIRHSYLLNLDLHYRMEQRWPDSEFWSRRHRNSPVVAGSPEG